MSLMTLSQALALLKPTVPSAALVGAGNTAFARVHSDTRTLVMGDLFVALRGERFDAHDFVERAEAAGAAAVMASRGHFANGLLVPDTLVALQALASAWRRRFTLPLIAVTGSNGKTTVTQMIASILRAWMGPAALATEGNYNNHIGVPLTLMRLRQDAVVHHRAAVLELGMNHPGEIALLADMAQPTVALVNNAQREHQEFMDSVEAVARENGSVISALPANGVAVLPDDDAQCAVWRALAQSRRVLSFGRTPRADVFVQGQAHDTGWRAQLRTPQGTLETTLALAGDHNLLNAAAATAAALAAGAPQDSIGRGLADFRPVKGRSQLQRLRWRGRDVVLVDDSYNANPDSVRAAIDVLAAMPAPRWLVLGDMGEVGTQGEAFHQEVGRYARERGVQSLWVAGPMSVHTAKAFGDAPVFVDATSLVGALNDAPACASVLIKGSRFMAMERVVHALQAAAGEGARDAR